MFIYSEKQLEQAEEHDLDEEFVLIGITVKETVNSGGEERRVGAIPTRSFNSGMNFPNPSGTLSGGTKYVVLMPDSGLGGLESDNRLEIHYAPGEIAKCMLSGNYLAPAVFSRSGNMDVREMVFEQLGLTDHGIQSDNQEYRQQLREIAGMGDVDVEAEETQTRAQELRSEHKYSELQTMAKEAGIDDARQSKEALSEYIASAEGE